VVEIEQTILGGPLGVHHLQDLVEEVGKTLGISDRRANLGQPEEELFERQLGRL
jgi:hypothetical protein